MTDRAFPWQQRLPFAGLLFSAIGGILLAAFLPIAPRPWLAGLGIFLLVWMIHRRPAWIYLAAGCAFAALQVWQTRESPSARLAELVGNEPAVATVQGRVIGYSDGKPGAKIRFLLEVEELELRGETLQPACRILVSAAVKPPLWNDRVVASGNLRLLPSPRNLRPSQAGNRSTKSRWWSPPRRSKKNWSTRRRR